VIAVAFWIAVLATIALIFYLLWRFAEKIEREEEEERRWSEYLTFLWHTDPHQANYWQQVHDQRR
jgi:hypothetical protein